MIKSKIVYGERTSPNQVIGLVVSGIVTSTSCIASIGAMGWDISLRMGSDNILLGLAVLVPLAFSGVIIKLLISHNVNKEFSILLTRIAMLIYLVALPVFFIEVAQHFLGLSFSSASETTTQIGLNLGGSSQTGSKALLYGSGIIVEILSTYFACEAWQQFSDLPYNPKYFRIIKDMYLAKKRIQKREKRFGKLAARHDKLIRAMARNNAAQASIQSLYHDVIEFLKNR